MSDLNVKSYRCPACGRFFSFPGRSPVEVAATALDDRRRRDSKIPELRPPVDLDTFLHQLRTSSLARPDEIEAAVRSAESGSPGDDTLYSDVLARLIGAGVVTRWQCEQLVRGQPDVLRRGKYILELHYANSRAFAARHRFLGNHATLKIFDLSDDRYAIEALHKHVSFFAQVPHPNLVNVYDYVIDSGGAYFVRPNADGCDLRELVARAGPLSAEVAIWYMLYIFHAVAYIHEVDGVCYTINPNHIIIDHYGTPRLITDGTSWFSHEFRAQVARHAVDERREVSYVSGTYDDYRADIISLGCVLYFALTGSDPLEEHTSERWLASLWREHGHRLPENSRGFLDAIFNQQDLPSLVQLAAAAARWFCGSVDHA